MKLLPSKVTIATPFTEICKFSQVAHLGHENLRGWLAVHLAALTISSSTVPQFPFRSVVVIFLVLLIIVGEYKVMEMIIFESPKYKTLLTV